MKKSIIIGLVGAMFLTAGGSYIPSVGGYAVNKVVVVGDFDNDGYDDLFVHDKNFSTYSYNQGIYSFAKKIYLLELPSTDEYKDVVSANLDDSPGVEIIFDGRVYTYTDGTTTQQVK